MFERSSRCTVLVHSSPNFLRIARLETEGSNQRRVLAAAELPPDDPAALSAWMAQETETGGGWAAGICGFHPAGSILAREDILVRNDTGPTPEALEALVQRRAVSPSNDGWRIGLIDAVTGGNVPMKSGAHTTLLVAVPQGEASTFQRAMLKQRIRPRQTDFATLPALGAISRQFKSASGNGAIAVCEFGLRSTTVFYVDRKGVHPQEPLPFGLYTLEESAHKDLKTDTIEDAQEALNAPDEATRKLLPKLLRIYARHLRLNLDYFEHQTGRIVGSLFATNLPANRQWLGTALAHEVDLKCPPLDVPAWAADQGLIAEDLPANGAGWMTTLALAAELSTPSHAPSD
ncbi:hypothetical protein [Synoicihabitans lomoniglobus]|uniref:Uncharacterized protein n=1 Tax=Synoicihabitans lomoniglobus TaxID=2909285 RepID=A0AAE9ZU34_9BACT|nr:hypothetical protein [Opitutaceae bacterium LMO-M01]WED64306.1 hypothetical protein PXH66_18365 [Opitutaceae bacterium LMO-M01]